MNFKIQNNEINNKDFNLDELVEAIQLSHDSATGPDEIHYQMLKHLPDTSLETLLNIFNYIWTTGKFPEDWTLATIIPIPKPGKDPAESNNPRSDSTTLPWSLGHTSHLGTILIVILVPIRECQE